MVIVSLLLPSTVHPGVLGVVVVCLTPFTQTSLIVIVVVPVFWKVAVMSVAVNSRFVNCPCSVAMKLNDSAPIHAATAMLTATVTAMRMIDATTGLRAFLLLVFIFLFIPPFGTGMYARGSERFKSYDSLHNIRRLQETVEHQYSQIRKNYCNND
jgi:hypothetical protein